MIVTNLISVVVPGVLALLLSWLLNKFSPVVCDDPYIGLIFFTVLCFISNVIYVSQKNKENFTGLLMGGIVVKLLLGLIVIFTYAALNMAGFFNFSIHFILYYVLFTIFEIRFI